MNNIIKTSHCPNCKQIDYSKETLYSGYTIESFLDQFIFSKVFKLKISTMFPLPIYKTILGKETTDVFYEGESTQFSHYIYDDDITLIFEDLELIKVICKYCEQECYKLNNEFYYTISKVDELFKKYNKLKKRSNTINNNLITCIENDKLKTSYENLLQVFRMGLHINFKCFAIRNLIEAFALYKNKELPKDKQYEEVKIAKCPGLVNFLHNYTKINDNVRESLKTIIDDTHNGIHIKPNQANEQLVKIAKLYIEQLLKKEFEYPALENEYQNKLQQYKDETQENQNKLEKEIKQFQQKV